MTKTQALCNVEDASTNESTPDIEAAIREAMDVGVKPWSIKQTLRECYIPWSTLDVSIQELIS